MASGIAFGKRAWAASAVAASLVLVAPAQAQDDGSRAVVQPLPPPEARQLSEALQRLASNPHDLDALIAAGNASLRLDDIDAALGFFARAEEIAPNDPRTKAGMAAAAVQDENPFEALRLFDEAERAGASLAPLTNDRALAYDLVGDNARAQQLYREVLARGENAEASRRLAISLAISGDEAGMERVLLPMLQRRDLAAYRARAFALAILGKVDEATTISDAVMPKSMAARIAPYLRYMPRLTRAQQAAAANLGNFPRTADIGRDDPRIARLGDAGAAPAARQPSGVDARLVPSGEPLGPSTEEGGRRPVADQVVLAAPPAAREAEPEVVPSPPMETAAVATASSDSELVSAQAPAAETALAEVALLEIPGPAISLSEPESTAVSAPGPAFDLAQIAGSREAALADILEPDDVAPALAQPNSDPGIPVPDAQVTLAAVAPAPAEPPAGGAVSQPVIVDTVEPVAIAPSQAASSQMEVLNGPAGATATATNVASAFADFEFSLAPTAPAAGAVDLTRISVPREKVEPKPAAPAHPARHWVQLATGRDRARLGFDFRRISEGSKGLLKNSRGYLARWGETNRLLTGPFASEAAAQAFVTKLDDTGIKAFTFSSEAGEEVTAVPAR